MRFYGGGPVGVGNAGVFNNSIIGSNSNPLLDPRFKIQAGQPQLPGASIGNVGGLLAQAPSNTQQDVGGFEKLLEGMEEQQRMRMRGANQFMTAPNQFIPYPIQQY